jgi:hypothetical protein
MRTPSTSARLLVAASAVLALLGCRVQQPPTVVPAPPGIASFSASAAQVTAGEKATLSWKVTDATSVELREATLGDLGVPVDQLEGTLEVTPAADALYVLTARGPGGSDARAVSVTVKGATVSDVAFRALPPVIEAGASATLAWTAPGAQQISVTAGGQALPLAGQREAGAVTVTPRFDTTYTLTADTETRTLTLEVQPGVLTAALNPPAAEVGAPVTLSWTAGGAERLVVSSPGRGTLREVTTAADIASGSFTEPAPARPTNGVVTYVVTAVKGTVQRSKTVELAVGTSLAINSFTAPAVAAAGAGYSVRWTTIGAQRVEVLVDGLRVFQSASGTEAGNGGFGFTAPANDFSVELVAFDGRGAEARQLAQVDAVGVPTAATLTASPASVTAGQPVTLTFASQEARRVRIVDSDGQTVFSLTGQPAEGGTATVYPNASTTYTLSADNLLGNPAVTATAMVTVTGTPVTVTQSPPTALDGQNVTLTPSTAGAVLYGFPHGQVTTASRASFLDISGTGQKVLETGSTVTTVTPAFSTWLWGTRQTGSLTISAAGWMAWGGPAAVNSSNLALPSTSTTAAPFLIAPFWDALTLTANSGVYWQLVGEAPEQVLVVQWDRLQVGSDTTTEVTFQAQVHQAGTVSFQYKTMTLATGYSSFTIGVQDGTRTTAVTWGGTPASDSAVYFFSPVADPVEFRARAGTRWGGFVKTGTGYALVSQATQAVSVPRDLALTELMFNPAASVPQGQYLEVLNRTPTPLDLSGWSLAAGAGRFDVPTGFTVAPGVPTLLGASTDPAENDDAGVTLAWGAGFALPADGGTLTIGTADASVAFSYAAFADAGAGVSLTVDPQPYLFSTGLGFDICPSTTPFGSQSPPQQGSPGSLGTCGTFPYAGQSIPVNFQDISATGTAVFTGSSLDTVISAVTLSDGTTPRPTAFGVPRNELKVSSNGFLTFNMGNTSAASGNKTAPSSSDPVGTVAIFWEDLDIRTGATPPGNVYWKRFEPNEDPLTPARHWVFQWHRWSYWLSSPEDDLNFEVKLFEDGTIEYHYGTMTSGTSSGYGTGFSATVWLENPAGTQALVRSVNEPLVQSNSAYRFIPR